MADDSPTANSSSEGDSPPGGHSGHNATPSIIDFLTMGVSTALCLVLGGGIGYGIDALAGTSPILTFVGLAFGVVAAVLVTITLVRKYL
ncbi:MAG TPA: AtpZ/AtpI family protein [Acidimicrobiales bacterium]|jgi:F0F1-type ATP synthase assembly protein I|nr:AtpZ/AtpI family protein [Acidimicrobiales bacterium]